MIKNFFYKKQNTYDPSLYILQGAGITVDGTGKFVFPAGAFNFVNRVDIAKPSSYGDVSFEYPIQISAGFNTVTGILGFGFMASTAGFFGEAQTFVFANGSIDFYHANTLVYHVGSFNLTPYVGTGKTLNVTFGRTDDHYWINIAGQLFDITAVGDGGYWFRQTIYPSILGNGITIKVMSMRNYTRSGNVKFAFTGDSIINGFNAGAMQYTPTGVLRGLGVDINRFSGSANVVNDQLTSFYEVAIVKPKYLIICFGHNDQYFGTGHLLRDMKLLVSKCLNNGITPIICNVIDTTWIDVSIPNAPIQKYWFTPKHLNLDIHGTAGLVHPTDYLDGAHLTISGNNKLATTIYNFIKTLP